MKALAVVLGLVFGVLAVCLGLFLLGLGLGHLFGLRGGGDTFDFILLLPGAFLVLFGAALCWRHWRRLGRRGN